MAIIELNVTIVNELGLHARPAAEFVKMAAKFESTVEVTKDDATVNGKSILGVMTLAAECGSTLTIRSEGSDAEGAVHALSELVKRGFRV